ncbi:MAG TPA: GNAT family N-acetyltransferase [Oscillospiraceae bacterium]|nr:GNAT family N-acetyltransferase [Oscillospiraceae bacterium]HPF55947.1 GNAT family N-acetyltransferase [Clostridiales bacterium]HPK36164.1 GNAT family N-acetyltransferase [Oscillospiraceae bacterium]HPR76542.1 GNAT family N-acetyltransferase [Oscillospiraceae bacterium]
MNYIIKYVTTEQELDAALEFNMKIFGTRSDAPDYTREKWLERIKTYDDLMLFAESDGKVIGIVFGRVERGVSVTVGPVAVDECFRKHGIARNMILLLEKRALRHGIHHLCLGAAETAEGFYEKLGYTGTLLIQSEENSIEKLLSLNTKYRVHHTNVYGGTINQVYLELPAADRELQRRYENTLPGCYTQMVFEKKI